jgi:ABC-2 type transport system ATP-binding protein
VRCARSPRAFPHAELVGEDHRLDRVPKLKLVEDMRQVLLDGGLGDMQPLGMTDLAIETRRLSKRFPNGVLAVDDVAMHVRRGEVYGFLGPNGAGKTTTLRMLLGLCRPSAGEARVAGEQPGTAAGLRRIGALIEAPGFYPYLSGRENLRVVARMAGDAALRRVDEVLDLVDLTSRAGRKFATYSTGMKQRLGVAAALLKDPQLLILDEPSNGLDPQGMAEMRRLIKDIAGDGRTVLLSSHLLGEVEQICDRVGVIHSGRLVRESTLAEMRGEPTLLVRPDRIEAAHDLLAAKLGPQAVTRRHDHLELAVDPGRSTEINYSLMEAGIGVSELRPVEATLEDVFFQLTGDKQG